MKISIVITARQPVFGGAERNMVRLAEALVAQGHCVTAHVPVTNLPVQQAFCSVRATVRPLSLARASEFIISAREQDVVYVMGARQGLIWTFLSTVIAGTPSIGSERSSGAGISTKICHFLSSLWCHAIIANSNVGKRAVAAATSGFCDIFRIPNGLRVPALKPSRRPVELVCVANLTSNKGQTILLQAVHLLQNDFPGLRAHLYGADLMSGEFQQHAESRGLAGCYVYHGAVAEVWDVLAGAKICCLPSLVREGLPTSLIEAAFAGAALVASDVGGVSDVCVHGETGLLVPPGDPVQLAAAIALLLRDIRLRDQLATAAVRKARSEFTIDAMLYRHLEVFASAR